MLSGMHGDLTSDTKNIIPSNTKCPWFWHAINSQLYYATLDIFGVLASKFQQIQISQNNKLSTVSVQILTKSNSNKCGAASIVRGNSQRFLKIFQNLLFSKEVNNFNLPHLLRSKLPECPTSLFSKSVWFNIKILIFHYTKILFFKTAEYIPSLPGILHLLNVTVCLCASDQDELWQKTLGSKSLQFNSQPTDWSIGYILHLLERTFILLIFQRQLQWHFLWELQQKILVHKVLTKFVGPTVAAGVS